MKILVAGSRGFVGRNLCVRLRSMRDGNVENSNISVEEIFEYDVDTPETDLDRFCSEADFVFNLAGAMRPKNKDEFMRNNFGFASDLLNCLALHGNKCPVMIASSIQAEQNNLYGESKKAGEELMFKYARETGAKVLVYRFTNLFGKWGRPNYNSVISTFCYNIANGLPITINDAEVVLPLVHIDDVVDELVSALEGNEHMMESFCYVPVVHQVRLGNIAEMLYSFKDALARGDIPVLRDSFTRKLFSTYVSYLPEYEIVAKLNHKDGNSELRIGQSCIEALVVEPNESYGPYWHDTSFERIVVAKGEGLLILSIMDNSLSGNDRMRKELSIDACSFPIANIPPGYVFELKNKSLLSELVAIRLTV